MAKKMYVCNAGVTCTDCTKCDGCNWNTVRCQFNDGVACSNPVRCRSCGWNPANIELRTRKAINRLAAKVISTPLPTAA